jgi:hypothetical protein
MPTMGEPEVGSGLSLLLSADLLKSVGKNWRRVAVALLAIGLVAATIAVVVISWH